MPAIDWRDLDGAAVVATDLLERLAADRALLTSLTAAAVDDEVLRPLCECHAFDDKIVIYDALATRGFRIRWRLAKSIKSEQAHMHRFSFATRVMAGAHFETLYNGGKQEEDSLVAGDLAPLMVRELVEGQTFVIHHGTIHSTTTAPGTVGLLLRGPAEKRRAVNIRKSDGSRSFRYGADDETAERRRQVAMSDDVFERWQQMLRERAFID